MCTLFLSRSHLPWKDIMKPTLENWTRLTDAEQRRFFALMRRRNGWDVAMEPWMVMATDEEYFLAELALILTMFRRPVYVEFPSTIKKRSRDPESDDDVAGPSCRSRKQGCPRRLVM